MARAAWVAILLVLTYSGAVAARPLCRMEQPALAGDELALLATQVTLKGELRRGVTFSLEVPGKSSPLLPSRQQSWPLEEQPLSFVLLVEGSAAYAPATDALRTALERFLSALPRTSQGLLWRFTEQTQGISSFRPPAQLRGEAESYNAIGEGDLRLVRAVRQAQTTLSKIPAGARRAIILVADGSNSVMDPQLFYVTGESLGRDELPVYSIGFSPQGARGPLRNLGDLSKRSGGTFRWAKTVDELEPQLLNLAEELKGAQLLTFTRAELARLGTGELPRLRLRCGEGVSNFGRLRLLPQARSGWWLVALLLPLGVGAVFLVLRRLIRRRRPITAAQEAAPIPPLLEPGTLTIPLPPRPVLVAADGSRLAILDRLELGSAQGTILREGASCKLVAHGPSVRLNGHSLVGAMRLSDGDWIEVEGAGAWTVWLGSG